MKKVGILVGREQSFPDALIRRVNERGQGEVTAEFVKVGGVRHDAEKPYDIIIDRISHQVPFYRAFLKRAALEGTLIINNPFWWSADDKFFNYSLAAKLGVAVPRTVLLPQKEYMEDITGDSLRNLEFPLDWQGIADYVGFPAIIKPFDGGGWKNVSKVSSLEELWRVYDTTGTLCMTLQEFVAFDQFVRCYCIGQQDVMIMPYDPRKPYLSGEQYINDPNYLSAELAERVTNDVRTLCTALGYDLNTVEFAIEGDTPYAIDFMNPAPDADVNSVGEFYHNWVAGAVTDLIFRKLEEPQAAPRYRWDALLNPAPAQETAQVVSAVASAAEQSARTIIPEPVRDITSDVVSGVGELVSQATSTVTDIISSVVEPPSGGDPAKPARRSRASTAESKTSKSAAAKSPANASKTPARKGATTSKGTNSRAKKLPDA